MAVAGYPLSRNRDATIIASFSKSWEIEFEVQRVVRIPMDILMSISLLSVQRRGNTPICQRY